MPLNVNIKDPNMRTAVAIADLAVSLLCHGERRSMKPWWKFDPSLECQFPVNVESWEKSSKGR